MVKVEIFGGDNLRIEATMEEGKAKNIGRKIDYAIFSQKCMEIKGKDGTRIILGYKMLYDIVVKISSEEN